MAEHLASDDFSDDEPELAAERLARGTHLGRYELLLPIAKGGMARVWAARQHGHRGFTKLVAIKTILPHLAKDTEFERMFLDEARIASMVHHPNVCEIYELGEEGKVLYIAMEWVNGESFAHILRASGTTEPLEPRVVARIVSDACAGLNAAHDLTDDEGRSLGVVHRDVSPHNILISAGGHVKVADFGVAKALGQMHSATSTGQLKGKLNYMAPEQVTATHVDRRSDIFSMGCVLYEATTGVQPFKGDGDHQVMHRLLKGEIVLPTRVVNGYPEELEKIILRAMAADPMSRYPSAERLRAALEEWLAKGPVVTDTHVAGAVRARVGTILDKRRERIRAAQSTSERFEFGTEPPPLEGLTPSGRGRSGSGVVSASRSGAPTSPRPPPDRGSMPGASSTSTVGPRKGAPMTTGLTMPLSPSQPPPSAERPSVTKYHPVPDARRLASPERLSSSPPSIPSTPSLPSDGTGSESRARAVPARGQERAQYAVALLLAVVAFAAAGAIGFFLWRAGHPVPVTSIAIPTSAMPVESRSPQPPPPDTSITVEAVEPVIFLVTPDTAVLVVDGVEQAANVRAVTRKPGRSVNVMVRAPNFEDATLQVDDSTSKAVAVSLTPRRRIRLSGDQNPKRNDPLPANPYPLPVNPY